MKFFNKFYHWSFAIITLVTFLYFGSVVLSCVNGIDESKLQEICERENTCDSPQKLGVMDLCEGQVNDLITWIILTPLIFNAIYILFYFIRNRE